MANETVISEENTQGNQDKGVEKDGTQGDVLTFTPSEFDSEVDKRISNALDTAKSKWEEEKQNEITKAQELAKMSANERKQAEDKAKQEALDKREKELNIREYRYEAKRQLEDNGMSDEFVDMVISESAESTNENIKALKVAFDSAVEQKVNERLKGNAPQVGTGSQAMTKSEILAIKDQTQRQKMIAENLNLFK